MTDQSLVPSVIDDKAALALYNDLSGVSGYAGMADTHDVQQIGTPILRWKLMGASAGSREGGKFYNSLESDVAYDELPVVFIDGKNSRAYYEKSYDPKAKVAAAPPDCKSNDGLLGVGTPGGNCTTCPMAKWIDNSPPACTLSYDRLIFDFHTNQLGIMSFSKTKIKALQEFEKARKARNGGTIPMWAWSTVIRSERRDAYWVPKIDIVGILPPDDAKKFFELKKESESRFLQTSADVVAASNIASALDEPDIDPAVGASSY